MKRVRLSYLLFVLGLLAACAQVPSPAGGQLDTAAANDPLINEFVANHTGTDTNEYIEVAGDANTDYSAFTVLEVEGDAGSTTGVIDGVFALGTTNDEGYWTTGFLNNEIENGSVTLLLVESFTGSAGDDLDTDDDGSLDVTPWARIVDGVAVSDGGDGDQTYALALEPGYDGVSFSVGGASRIPDAADTDAASDWTRNDFDGAGLPGFSGSLEEGEALNTPGAANTTELDSGGGGGTGVCGGEATLISAVQGSGDASPLEGSLVTIEGVVVGDFQEDDGDLFNTDLDGFFVQEEPSDEDGDPATSEGVFVYAPGAADVSVGDLVRVTGGVVEFGGLTELSDVTSLELCGSAELPEPTDLYLPLSDEELERFEGMYVVFPQQLVISEYFNFDRFGEIVLSLPLPEDEARVYQPTSYLDPDTQTDLIDETQEEIEVRRIILDDGRSSQNPDPARHPNGEIFDLENRFRGGDLVENTTGVLSYGFGEFRVQPTEGADYIQTNPRPEGPEEVGGSLRIATFNVLNYFLTLDDGGDICGPEQDQECRGADTEEEFKRQKAKIIAALVELDADIFGLVELENTAAVSPLEDIVAALNAELGAGTYAYIDTGTIGGDAIKVGIIYKPEVVTPLGDYAVLDDPSFTDPADTGEDKNRPALAQTFEDTEGGVVTVVVNHLKSKGSGCGPGDDDPLEGNCNLTRTLAAEALADWLATNPTGSGDPDVLIIGDLNAYDEEDPIDALKAGADDTLGTLDDYVDLVELFEGEFAYSYVFDGQFGYLDYALASRCLVPQVTGTTTWHINADEPDILDYDTSFKQDAQDALYEPNPYRSSDHDPVLVGLDLLAGPEDFLNVLLDEVAALLDEGVLNKGQANALVKKLEQVQKLLDKGQSKVAFNALTALENQLMSFIEEGILLPEQGAELLCFTGGLRTSTH